MLSLFERLDIFMKTKGLNDNKITLETGISNGIIGKARKRGSLSQDNISKILYSYPDLNANWLFTGEGEMLKDKQSYNVEKQDDSVVVSEPALSVYNLKTDYFNQDRQMIPLYDYSATLGLMSVFHDNTNNVPLDYISIPNAPKCDGAIFVRGDSMYPILKSGDIICYKMIYEIQNVRHGEIYLLDIDDGDDQYLTVKYIQPSEMGDKYLKLVSQNTHHAPKDEKVSNVRAIAIVKVSIRYNTIS